MDLHRYHGSGYSILYPADGHVDTIAAGAGYARHVEILGRTLREIATAVAHDSTAWRNEREYQIRIDSIPNRSHRSLRAVVDSMVRRFGAFTASSFDAPRLDSLQVDGEKAYRLDPYCGDCSFSEVYFGRGAHIVRLTWQENDDDLFLTMSEALFWLMVRSFRWD